MAFRDRFDEDGAESLRERGNTLFAQGRWSEAIAHYTKAIELYPLDDRAWSNRSMANIKLERWEDAEFDATTALSRGATTKALYHPPVVIDYSAYPHILDGIIQYADPEVRVALRQTCRSLRNRLLGINLHVEITASPSNSQEPYLDFVQAQPLGNSFRRYLKDTLLPSTPEERKKRTTLDLSLSGGRRHDLRGVVDSDLLEALVVTTNTVRIRMDDKGFSADSNIFLDKLEFLTAVVFPTTDPLAHDIFAVRGGPMLLNLPVTVTRLVYPLATPSPTQPFLAVAGILWDPRHVKIVNIAGVIPLLAAQVQCTATVPVNTVDLEIVFKTALKDKIWEGVDARTTEYYQTPASLILKEPPPSAEEGLRKIQFLTKDEYCAELKPGEWEEQTVEVMPGFK
ncbi:uncharacterized protein EHS24_004512 [Apiotrichum porosum]|uniref:Uncharacterized protein n=1 Tax=Apiotrichum porosum TaxID=105984 RepID=A0A427Y5B9_9TREE|nr:uncharacterized protein EHS24_004512 [Apiotrichum porosum]RSH86274.1 hypothetical protein EHS24_004512 [Apiotrichum porosum]